MAEDLQLAAKVHYAFLPDDYDDDRLNIAATLRLSAGDRFLIYPDGLIEVENAEGQAFGSEGLSNTFIAQRNLSGQALNKAILMQAESYAADGFKDDVLLVSITLK